MDLDKSGRGFQQVRTWLGPSLGWAMEEVQPETKVTLPGTYTVQPGDSIILVDSAGVTIALPDVVRWWKQTANQPATGFDRSITVKDFGGTGDTTITPFGTQEIDNAPQPIFINSPGGTARLTPLVDLTGWIIESGTGIGGTMNTVFDLGTVSSGIAVFDFHNGQKQKLTVGGSIGAAFTGWPATGIYGEIEVQLINGGLGVAWTTVHWLKGDGTNSTVFSTMGVTLNASGVNWVIVWTEDGGATLWGRAA